MTIENKLKVCMVSALPNLHSGLALYTKGLISGFGKRRGSCKLVVIANNSAQQTITENSLVEVRKTWTRGNRYFFQVLKSLIREKPKVVHFQHEFFLFGGMTTAALFPVLLGFSRLLNIKTVVTMHGVISKKAANEDFARAFFVPKNYLLLQIGLSSLTTMIGRLSNSIIVHSAIAKKELIRDFKINADKINVVPHGIGQYTLGDKIDSSEKMVLFFGNITPSKGLETLISAFQKINEPSARLIIAGGPHPRGAEYFESINHLVQSSKEPEKIAITGYVKDEDIHRLFEQCTIAVFPYTSSVSCSGGLSFALQHRKPVIVTSLPSFTETITDGINGLVVNPNDDTALSNAIQRLLSSPKLRQQITNGIAKECARLQWPAIAEETEKCYLEITNA